jgi:hypothetical protein
MGAPWAKRGHLHYVGVIDKAGFNQLFIPHQSPLFSLNQSSLFLTTSTMSPSHPSNTYTIPFDPICNSPGEYATAQEKFNHQQFEKKRGSRVTLYPSFDGVYQRSA